MIDVGDAPGRGIRVAAGSAWRLQQLRRDLGGWLCAQGIPVDLLRFASGRHAQDRMHLGCWLADHEDFCHAPDFDTLGLHQRLAGYPCPQGKELAREILVALLCGPQPVAFSSSQELRAHLDMRCNIVTAALNTRLSFCTCRGDRPSALWNMHPEYGNVVKPGCTAIDALTAATQPGTGESEFPFSCYRATEYVILLGIAQALERYNRRLLKHLQRQCEVWVIRSRRFHEVFLREHGSMAHPLPPAWYVPGDRVWFRNPDERSADVAGFEGSWVIYLGQGLFSNLWQPERPFTLLDKFLEIYHWRDAMKPDPVNGATVDEDEVAQLVDATRRDPAACAGIALKMARYRDPAGVYADGGCIDATREFPREICPGTTDIILHPVLLP